MTGKMILSLVKESVKNNKAIIFNDGKGDMELKKTKIKINKKK